MEIPFEVVRGVPCVLWLNTSSSVAITGSAQRVYVLVPEDTSPTFSASIWKPDFVSLCPLWWVADIWQLVGSVFIRHPFVGAPPYIPNHLHIEDRKSTVFLDAGYHVLRITWSGEIGGVAESEEDNLVIGAPGGGIGISVLLVANRTHIPLAPIEAFLADVDSNYAVDDGDLIAVLLSFGTEDEIADINKDGFVDDSDLLLVLLHFGFSY